MLEACLFNQVSTHVWAKLLHNFNGVSDNERKNIIWVQSIDLHMSDVSETVPNSSYHQSDREESILLTKKFRILRNCLAKLLVCIEDPSRPNFLTVGPL